MKRLLSMLLVAAMLLGILPATALATSAEMVEYVYLTGLPEEIAPGAAQLPDVQPVEGQVTVTEIRWLHENQDDGVPVTAFEEGNAYLLSVTLEVNEGYTLSDWINIETESKKYDDYFIEDMACTVLFRYSMLEDAGEILVQINEPAEGMDISALTATVTGNAILNDIQVYDANTGEVITEGTFAPKKNYQINYTLKPKEGYEFSYQNTTLEVNDGQIGVEWYTGPQHLLFPVYFSTCEVIDTMNLTLSDVLPGVKREDVTLDAPQSAPYLIETYWFETYNTDEEWDTFQQVYNYNLHVDLLPKDGYVFSPDTLAYVNGEEVEFWSYDGYIRGNISMEFSFSVDDLWLDELPQEIEAGEAEIPTVSHSEQVEITDVKWLDASKQPVTAFADGNAYYLAVTLEAVGSRGFGEDTDLQVDYRLNADLEILTDKQAVVYIRYSLEPSAGALAVTVTGTETGDLFTEVEATVAGNATVDAVAVFEYISYGPDSYGMEMPQGDAFEAGKIYVVRCGLRPAPGYRFDDEIQVTVNGEEFYDLGGNDTYLELDTFAHGCSEIDTVTLTMPEVKVGKSFSDLQAKAPGGANYTVETVWYDVDSWDRVTGKVQSGHRYEMMVQVCCEDGYVFAAEPAATLNGQPFELMPQAPGLYAKGWDEISFMTPITKVELPAMPTSIQKNKTLPVATVSGKNYTLSVYWSNANGEEKTVADEDGIYLLVWSAEVKDGYEFTEDTKFYMDGKEVYPLESGWRDGQFVQSYSIGIPTVERVDLICAEPQVGQEPPAVTVPADAQYVLAQVSWGQSATGDWRDIEATAEVLRGGLRTYASGMLLVPEGMALDTNVAFYVGGQKMTPLVIYNMGQVAIVMFDLGVLGQLQKLEAPRVEVIDEMGQYLQWEEVPNAVGYEIYRATSKSGKYTKVATLSAEDWSWEDSSAAPAKTYYYKLKAISADSQYNSGYSSALPVAYKLAIPMVMISDNEATGRPVFSWEKVAGAKSYDIYRGTSMDNMKKYANTSKLTYTDTKAAIGVEYCYAVRAIVSSKSAYNSDLGVSFLCVAACPQPVVKAAVDAATGKPVISWAKVTGAESYQVFRKLEGEETYSLLTEQTATSLVDTTAPIDTLCSYMVQAMHSADYADSAKSAEVSAVSAIGRPDMKAAVDATTGKPAFTWEAVEGAVKYEIYRSTKSTKGYSLLTTVEGTSYVDESVSAGKTYYYKMVALGQVSKSAETSYVKLTGKCAVPTISVSTDPDSGKPRISWEKITGAKKYTVYRATSENGKYTKLGTTKNLTYTDSKAVNGNTYFYKIIANASSSKYNSGYSNIGSCDVICGRPTVTVKKDTATGKPQLSWTKVTGAAGYRIQRQLPGEEGFVVIADGVTGTSFLDDAAPIDTLCAYRVRALGSNELLNSMMSDEVAVTSGIAQPKLQGGVNSEGKPRFDWQLVEGAVKYEIYRSTKSTKGYTLLATVEDGNAYRDETCAPGKTYYYKVVAVGESSKSAESAYVKLTGKCAAPWITAEAEHFSGKPLITWGKVAGAKKYTVYRATSRDGKYTKLGTTSKLSYTDSKATVATAYYYKIVANGSKSSYNSGYSNIVSCAATCAVPKLKATAVAATGKPVITWGKVTGAVRYEVWLEQAGAMEQLAETTGLTFTDETACPGETRIYWVYAVDALGEKAGEWIVATTACAQPALVGDLSADGKPVGWWNEVEGAQTYKVYRSTKKSSGFKEVAELTAESLFFIDDSAKAGKTYYYKIVAVCYDEYDQPVESAFSNTIKVKSK